MHIPVLLEESTDLLLGNGGKLYVDCTIGLGGHTRRILEKNPQAFVIGIDRDPYALEMAQENLKDNAISRQEMRVFVPLMMLNFLKDMATR